MKQARREALGEHVAYALGMIYLLCAAWAWRWGLGKTVEASSRAGRVYAFVYTAVVVPLVVLPTPGVLPEGLVLRLRGRMWMALPVVAWLLVLADASGWFGRVAGW